MDWKVRYVDYPKHFKGMESGYMDLIRDVLSRGDLMLRQQLRDFESNLAAFVGTKYAIGVSNCTDGLHLSLKALGIGHGDEVITVSHTFVATVSVIKHVGARPVLIDIGEDHNMNVDLVESAITPKTKAIIPVHLNGRLCDMGRLKAVAEKHGLIILEDSAQGLGASFKGVKGGAAGAAGCFSFYPAKLLGAFGDAGAVVTNDEKLAAKIMLMRDHGRGRNNEIELWGYNCRLDNIQAAVLDFKLKALPRCLERRREIAAIYDKGLRGIKGLILPPSPVSYGDFFDVFQNYEIEAEGRDELKAHLTKAGIETLVSWGGKGVHQFGALDLDFKLPRTERMFEGVIMLPMQTELSDDQVEYVVGSVREFYKQA